jgi:predicted DCC family thiol-disulfide oxidoreductase YuxK
MFGALQSEKSKELTNKFNFDTSNLDTFVLIAGDKFFTKSTAALMICKELNGLVKIMYPLIFFPKIFRDFIYDMIAKNRYKLFGRSDTCRVPTEAEKKKFL